VKEIKGPDIEGSPCQVNPTGCFGLYAHSENEYTNITRVRKPLSNVFESVTIASNLGKLGSFTLEMAPKFWKRYSDDLKREVVVAPHMPNPDAWSDTGLHAAWLGHSTVLLKIDGFTVLTDPSSVPG
jgi:hypothetical protein